MDEVSSLVSEVEGGQKGVPILLKQYLKLGGKILGFNVDPSFQNSLDSLIIVDLTQTDPTRLEQYMGGSTFVGVSEASLAKQQFERSSS